MSAGDFRAGRRSADLANIAEKRARFRKLIAGEKPFKLWNAGMGKLADPDVLGPPAQMTAFDRDDLERLVPLYDGAIDENLDALYEWFGLISPTTVFAGALVATVGMKAFLTYKAMKLAAEAEPRT